MTSGFATPLPGPAVREPWRSPIDIEAYDRNANLTEAERQELVGLVTNPHHAWWITPLRAQVLARLIRPISDVAAATHARPSVRTGLIKLVLLETGRCNMSFWGWRQQDWQRILCPNYKLFARRYGNGGGNAQGSRLHLFALVYLCRRIDSFRAFGRFEPTNLARRVFGEARINDSFTRASDLAVSWGYGRHYVLGCFRSRLAEALLDNRSPNLEDLKIEALSALRDSYESENCRQGIHTLSRVLCSLGILSDVLAPRWNEANGGKPNDVTEGIARDWLDYVSRWRDTSTLSPRSRQIYYQLLQAGR